MRPWILLPFVAALAPDLEGEDLARLGAAGPAQAHITRTENPHLRLVSWLNRKLPVTNHNAPLSLRDGALAGLTTADATLKAVRDEVRAALESASPPASSGADLHRPDLALNISRQATAMGLDPSAALTQFLSGNRPAVAATATAALAAEPEAEAAGDRVPTGLVALLAVGALILLAAFLRSRAD